MDGYRDLHLALSAGHYASSRYPAGYGVERRGSYVLGGGDPVHSIYSRAAADAYGGHLAPPAYPPPPEYPFFVSPRRRPNPKRRPPPQSSGKQRPAPAQSLTPRNKPFKKTSKATEAKPFRKPQESAGKPQVSGGPTLAKETEDLHKLFRTGVDSGIKIVNPKEGSGKKASANGPGKKRKADAKKGSPTKKKGKPRKKKFAKEKKQEVKAAAKLAEAASVPLTEEEKIEIELALELQKPVCKAFAEFFEIPVKTAKPELEAEKESAELDAGDDKTEAADHEEKHDDTLKPSPKPKLTPEMLKEIEEKSFNFFSKVLTENDELSKMYLDKKDAGAFECLVCHSINPETSKRFTNVTGLVSHTIMRRQRRPEHRGFGKALCHIFGWEPLRPNRPIKQATADGEIAKVVVVEEIVEMHEEKLIIGSDEK